MFVSVGAGTQVFLGRNDGEGSFGRRIAPTFDIGVGKWVIPQIGFRLQANGFTQKGYTYQADNQYVTGGPDADGLYKQKWNQFHIIGSVLVNASDWIGGYREDRLWDVVPFIGLGFMHSFGDGRAHNEFTMNLGVLNKVRISEVVDFNLEFRSAIFDSKYLNEQGGEKRQNAMIAVIAGFSYKINDWSFKRTYHK